MERAVSTILALAVTGLVGLTAPEALAQESGSASVLVGPGYTFGQQPVDGRISLRGEAGLATGDAATLGIVIPLTLAAHTGDDEFQLSLRRSIVELAPSLRARVAPLAVVTPYVDAGFGGALFLRNDEGEDFFDDAGDNDDIRSVAAMARAALGVEIGDPDAGMVFIVEPIGVNDYILSGDDQIRLSSMLGVGGTF